MIEPTNGRVVWYQPSCDDLRHMTQLGVQPFAAHVAFVHTDRCVNLLVIDHVGRTHQLERVLLVQAEDERPTELGFAEWMPYQKGQAAKNEKLEQKLGLSP